MMPMPANLVISSGLLVARLGFRRGHPVVGLLLVVLVLVLIVLGVVAIVTLFRNQGRQGHPDRGGASLAATGANYDPVITELRLRYARGEIDRDEYLRRAADLGYRPDPGSTTLV